MADLIEVCTGLGIRAVRAHLTVGALSFCNPSSGERYITHGVMIEMGPDVSPVEQILSAPLWRACAGEPPSTVICVRQQGQAKAIQITSWINDSNRGRIARFWSLQFVQLG